MNKVFLQSLRAVEQFYDFNAVTLTWNPHANGGGDGQYKPMIIIDWIEKIALRDPNISGDNGSSTHKKWPDTQS